MSKRQHFTILPRQNNQSKRPCIDAPKLSFKRLPNLRDQTKLKFINSQPSQQQPQNDQLLTPLTNDNEDYLSESEEEEDYENIASLDQLTSEYLKRNYVYVLISHTSQVFKQIKFIDIPNMSIGPYKLINRINEQIFDVEVGLSTDYDTKFNITELTYFGQEIYQPDPRNIKHFILSNSIESILGANVN
ncbi:uncharacterized protein KGF55_003289 [Candida pseudojiufengensis]|uniref:uncharacterized protein n=1 Tax=Candida pseudojiufengensis TaxID=497109 RepID=UPI002225B55D|nr:uncharacterized protein KGF55_003289 [Candida pseudojiufengensis]KAI5962213.1 hypothetical protein KGF55_003289 [Candida pseudojiufengensis]